MEYIEMPPTREERWDYWKDIRDDNTDLEKDALRDILEVCMREWGIRESKREEYLEELLKDVPD